MSARTTRIPCSCQRAARNTLPELPRRLAISLRVEICFETLDLKEAKALLATLTL